jgi:hypothetical protein
MRFLSYPYDLPAISLAERDALTPEDGALVNIANRELQKFSTFSGPTGKWLIIERAVTTDPTAPGDLRFDVEGRLHVPLWYPRQDASDRTFDGPRSIELHLVDVRAADSIRIDYDFERDGYAIKQASKFEWDEDDEVQDPDWQEVAFVAAWARDTRKVNPDGSVG